MKQFASTDKLMEMLEDGTYKRPVMTVTKEDVEEDTNVLLGNVQNRSIYADQEAAGSRVQVMTPNCHTPFLFDWDKAARDAGIRPLQLEEMEMADRFEIKSCRGKKFTNHEEESDEIDSISDSTAVGELFHFFRNCDKYGKIQT
jgi:hypothetical protein